MSEEKTAAATSVSAEAPPATSAAGVSDGDAIKKGVEDVLRTVYDPEIPVDIWELGLVYSVDVDEAGKVLVQMTLTAPGCPVAGSMPGEVEAKVRTVSGVRDAEVALVWDPPWNPEMMSEAAKLKLGFM